MTEQDILNQIAGEAKEGFSGDLGYEARKDREPSPSLPSYRVWNQNPFWDVDKQGPQPITPGIIMTTVEGQGEAMVKTKEVEQKIQAVILYTSHGRKFETGTGKTFKLACQSHDGVSPSLRVDEPLCREATKEDLVSILSSWKGADQAKIDANIATITKGTPQLQMCGLPTPGGNSPCITLCPFGKRQVTKDRKGNVIKTEKAPCQPHIYVQAYDLKLKRQFKMELTGKATWNDTKFVAPFHEFFRYLRAGVGGKSFPSYAFVIDLYPAKDGQSYYLGVKNWRPIEDANNRLEMENMAISAKQAYEKQASRLSKEEYAKIKAAKEKQVNNEDLSGLPDAPQVSRAVAVETPDDVPEPIATGPKKAVSFEEDDIPF